MMNRREFLGTAAATVLFSRLAAFAADEHRLGPIGLQLYTVRDQMEKDFDGSIAKVAATGYKEVEFAGYFKRTPQQARATFKLSWSRMRRGWPFTKWVRRAWGAIRKLPCSTLIIRRTTSRTCL